MRDYDILFCVDNLKGRLAVLRRERPHLRLHSCAQLHGQKPRHRKERRDVGDGAAFHIQIDDIRAAFQRGNVPDTAVVEQKLFHMGDASDAFQVGLPFPAKP